MAAVKIKTPPIVGVPAFDWWVSESSSLTTWPIWKSRRTRINQGPMTRLITNAVSPAAAVRNVMYWITFTCG